MRSPKVHDKRGFVPVETADASVVRSRLRQRVIITKEVHVPMSKEMSLVLAVPPDLYPDGADIRVIGTQDSPLFCLADVCGVLELSAPHMVAARLDDDEKVRSLASTPGGDQEMWFVTEPGLYRVIMRSDKPAAKAFTRWVTHEVLPSIRKHGCYPATGVKPKSRALMVLEMAQALYDQEERLGVVEGQLGTAVAVAEDARQMAKAALDTHASNYGYYAVLGYWKFRNWGELSYQEAARHGKALTAICEGLGATINTIADPRFGRVNTHPEHVLADYFDRLRDEAK